MQVSGDLTGFGVDDGRLGGGHRAGRPRLGGSLPHGGQGLMVVLERSHDVLFPRGGRDRGGGALRKGSRWDPIDRM
jgi:hypothetical protein